MIYSNMCYAGPGLKCGVSFWTGLEMQCVPFWTVLEMQHAVLGRACNDVFPFQTGIEKMTNMPNRV
jgi:hypothetical protein